MSTSRCFAFMTLNFSGTISMEQNMFCDQFIKLDLKMQTILRKYRNTTSETGQNIVTKMFCIITQPILIRSSRNLHHMKAEMLTFPTAQVSTQNPIWLPSYAQNNQGRARLPHCKFACNILSHGAVRVGNPSEHIKMFCFINLVPVA